MNAIDLLTAVADPGRARFLLQFFRRNRPGWSEQYDARDVVAVALNSDRAGALDLHPDAMLADVALRRCRAILLALRGRYEPPALAAREDNLTHMTRDSKPRHQNTE